MIGIKFQRVNRRDEFQHKLKDHFVRINKMVFGKKKLPKHVDRLNKDDDEIRNLPTAKENLTGVLAHHRLMFENGWTSIME
jgi:hypothetical protein